MSSILPISSNIYKCEYTIIKCECNIIMCENNIIKYKHYIDDHINKEGRKQGYTDHMRLDFMIINKITALQM